MAEIGAKAAIDVGSVINGRYEVLAELGQGGMGIVYKVLDNESNELRALKLLFADRVPDAQSVSRFNQEVRAASRLDHPNLTSVYDWGIAESGQPYMVMELVEGITLAARIAQAGQISIDEALRIFIQVCDGLGHAHGHGVLHRDLKPSNIIITGNGGAAETVKILDFGLAKIQTVSDVQSQQITRTGQLVGSPFYMSPEQARGVQVDERSDLYSLGCSMYEALTGGPPHIGANAMSTLMKRENDPPLTLSQGSMGKSFPEQVEHVVSRLLNLVPEQRFQSAGEVKDELHRLLKGEPIMSSPLATPPEKVTGQAQAPPKGRISMRVKVNSLLIILLAGSIFAWTAINSSKQRGTPKDGRDDKDVFHALPVYLPKEIPAIVPERLDEIKKSRQQFKSADLKASEETLLSGIKAYREKWGPGSPAEGAMQRELGELYLVSYKDYDKSYNALTKAFQIWRKDLPEGSESLANLTLKLGDAYGPVQGTHRNFDDRRLELYERAADIYGRLIPPRSELEARCLSEAAELRIKKEDLSPVQSMLKKSIEALENMHRPQDGLLFHTRRRLSTCYRHQRKFADALDCDLRTLSAVEANPKIRDKTLQRCMVLNEIGLDNLGFVEDETHYLDHRHLDAAKEQFEQSLRLSETNQSKYARQRMTAFQGLGEVCVSLSREGPFDIPKVNDYYQTALKLSLEDLDHEDAEIIYLKLAYLQLIAGNPQEESKYFGLALKEAPKSRWGHILQSQLQAVLYCRSTYKLDVAEKLGTELELETMRLLGRSSVQYANVCAELGEVYLAQKKRGNADNYLRRALAIYKERLGPKNDKTRKVISLLSK